MPQTWNSTCSLSPPMNLPHLLLVCLSQSASFLISPLLKCGPHSLLIQFSSQHIDQFKTCTLPWGANWGTWNEEEAAVLWGRLLYDSHSQKAMSHESPEYTHKSRKSQVCYTNTADRTPTDIYTLTKEPNAVAYKYITILERAERRRINLDIFEISLWQLSDWRQGELCIQGGCCFIS